jgi:hypothetical protein
VDVEENFFEAGGTSLSLAMTFARLSAAFEGQLQIGDVFAYPTVRKLSDYILSKGNSARRVTVEGVELNNECYGKGSGAELRHLCTNKTKAPLEELLKCALTYTLGRLSKNKQIKFYHYVENCCFSTVSCDIIVESTLKEIARNIRVEDDPWHRDQAVRKPGRRALIALQTGDRELSRSEEDKLLPLFDLWIRAKQTDRGTELRIRNISRTLTDPVCKTVLKVLAAFMEK